MACYHQHQGRYRLCGSRKQTGSAHRRRGGADRHRGSEGLPRVCRGRFRQDRGGFAGKLCGYGSGVLGGSEEGQGPGIHFRARNARGAGCFGRKKGGGLSLPTVGERKNPQPFSRRGVHAPE